MIRAILVVTMLLGYAHGKPHVVATHSILGNLVEAVGGDKITLDVLVPVNADTHSFVATPRDAVALKNADIVFENGLGLEYWLDRLYAASNSKGIRVKLGESLSGLIKTEGHGCVHGHCHGHGEYDPHVWMSVNNVKALVHAIAESLQKLDPTHKAYYTKRTDDYIKELRDLDEWIRAEINQIPPARRKLVTNHESFNYFGRDYGFLLMGTVLGSQSTDLVDPAASHIAKLSRMIKKEGVKAIFGENIQNNQLVKELGREAGLGEVKTLYTGALGVPDSEAGSYIDLMRYNIRVIVEGLK